MAAARADAPTEDRPTAGPAAQPQPGVSPAVGTTPAETVARPATIEPVIEPAVERPDAPQAPGPDGMPQSLPRRGDVALDEKGLAPRADMKQAKRDLDAGQVDTDLRATPGLDAQQRSALAGETTPQR